MRIAIVDDNPKDAQQLKTLMLNFFGGGCCRFFGGGAAAPQIDVFTSSVNFVDEFRPVYDVVFLETVMSLMDGFVVAGRIREIDKSVDLVFVSDHARLAIRGYDVAAMAFLLKPVTAEKLTSVMMRVQERMEEKKKDRSAWYFLDGEDEIRYVKIADIDYVEVYDNKLTFHIDNQTITMRGQLSHITEQFEAHGFCRCSACALINLRKINSITREAAVMTCGAEIAISRRKRAALIEAYKNCQW